jgi:hypothetical protein
MNMPIGVSVYNCTFVANCLFQGSLFLFLYKKRSSLHLNRFL